MCLNGHSSCQHAQPVIECNDLPTPIRAVEKRPFGNSLARHLFQTYRLSTELNRVSPVCPGATSLVFDWERKAAPHFNHIGDSVHTQSARGDVNRTQNPCSVAALRNTFVGALMQEATFGG